MAELHSFLESGGNKLQKGIEEIFEANMEAYVESFEEDLEDFLNSMDEKTQVTEIEPIPSEYEELEPSDACRIGDGKLRSIPGYNVSCEDLTGNSPVKFKILPRYSPTYFEIENLPIDPSHVGFYFTEIKPWTQIPFDAYYRGIIGGTYYASSFLECIADGI